MNICEICGKSHDGSYGSGRFCSKKCRMRYIGSQSNKNGKLNGHPQYNTGKTRFKSLNNWTCPYCDAVFDTKRHKIEHVRIVHYQTDRPICHAWNKGLTKKTSNKVAQIADTLKTLIAEGKLPPPGKTFEWTDERRAQQSDRKKLLYQEHPEKHPNRKCAGNRAKMTYPEQITYDWLNDYGFNPIHNYYLKTDSFTRYVDFYVPRFHLFIEVDGERWHNDPSLDQAKDIDAKTNGFYTLRIKPNLGICNQLIEYFNEMRY